MREGQAWEGREANPGLQELAQVPEPSGQRLRAQDAALAGDGSGGRQHLRRLRHQPPVRPHGRALLLLRIRRKTLHVNGVNLRISGPVLLKKVALRRDSGLGGGWVGVADGPMDSICTSHPAALGSILSVSRFY